MSSPYFWVIDGGDDLKKEAASVVDTNAKKADAAGNLIVLYWSSEKYGLVELL